MPTRQLLVGVAAVAAVAAIAFGFIGGAEQQSAGPPAKVAPEVEKQVRGLSVPEKVDAVLAVGFAGTNAGAAEVAKTQGGVVVRAENWPGAGGGSQLNSQLHAAGGPSATPPLVIGLQEGGEYRAYLDLPPAERQLDIGDGGDAAAAEASANATGAALKKAGFDLNLAPVADVATLDSPIADRAYGDDVDLVTEMTAAAVRGCRTAAIACAPAHFPGAGGETEDTDAGPASVSLDRDSLASRDLQPFRAAIAEKVPALVLSHAFYAAYEAVTPASMTSEIATDLLRSELGFEGVAITDDLAAGAISGGEQAPDAAVRAVGAGADLVVVTDPAAATRARLALINAANSGELPRERLDAAAARVIELKRQQGLLK